jgi:hypothetical protein
MASFERMGRGDRHGLLPYQTASPISQWNRSIYTLRYLRDPQLQRNVHRSQNRIGSYHQLRAFLAEVSGKKHLTGRTDLDVAIATNAAG